MWYIPDDLQQGPATEESCDDVDLSLPRMARRHSMYLSILSRLDAISSPARTRSRNRKLCAYCDKPKAMRCKKHGTRLCGYPNCTGLHRICRSISAEGSLTKDTCQIVALNTWVDSAVSIAAVLCFVVFVAWLVVVL